ncbi:9643_t:CDS:2 [Dentiscutata erythropus]|uniref:9643_t:CDS:1 n=1 Tax=Dentiscutata erythropus TaxID=1348616 RepID=A0A9N8Z914_9GLOM|nr:9643_t:CDS:2 [Dentiscutata erythropus]
MELIDCTGYKRVGEQMSQINEIYTIDEICKYKIFFALADLTDSDTYSFPVFDSTPGICQFMPKLILLAVIPHFGPLEMHS